MDIADEVRAVRKRLGYSQSDLARALGLANPEAGGRVTVAKWETRVREPAPYLRMALAYVEAIYKGLIDDPLT